jgi:hypothetical protein
MRHISKNLFSFDLNGQSQDGSGRLLPCPICKRKRMGGTGASLARGGDADA